MKRDPKLTDALSHTTGVLVVLAILVMVNVLLAGVRLRADLTEDGLYTLSDGTRALLRDLDRTVELKFFFSASNPDLPVPVKQFGQRVHDLLREYAAASRGKVTLERLDPQPDSDEEEWAQRYGVQGQAVDLLGVGPQVYLGLVAVSGTREAVIPVISPGQEPRLEYGVTRLISEVTQQRKTKVGVVSSLPVMGRPQMPFADAPRGWVIVEELKRQYEVLSLPTDLEAVPDDVGLLLLVHPKDLSEKTLFAVDQFVLKGGRILAFVDPLCLTEQQSLGSETQPWERPSVASDLNRLTKAWGVEMVSDRVVADPEAASQVGFGAGGSELMPTWLSIRGAPGIDPNEVVTSGLDFLMMPFAGALKGTPAEGLSRTVLVRASDGSALLPSFQATQPGADKMQAAAPEPAAALVVRLQGRFPTAFPDGRPEGAAEDAATTVLGQAEKDGVVVIVSDVDLLFDDYSARRGSFMGQTVYQPINDNLDFVLNLAEQVAGSEALIGLRSRGRIDRPFQRVLALAQAAQEKGQQEEFRLQARLQEAQARLNDLQRGKQEDQKFILSPEQKAEIEKFSKERFEAQRQLRDVRKNLRRDINRLGAVVKSVNLLAMPLAVAAFGVGYWWTRRSRAA